MRCLYSIILHMMWLALMYLLVAMSDKGYTLLWSGISFVLTRSLTMIACTDSALNHVGYLCVIGCRFQRSVWIGDLISSRTSSTLVSSTALWDSTLGGGSLTLGSYVLLGLADVGSAVVFVAASENIAGNSLIAVKVLLFKGTRGCIGCVWFNASDNSNAALFTV